MRRHQLIGLCLIFLALAASVFSEIPLELIILSVLLGAILLIAE